MEQLSIDADKSNRSVQTSMRYYLQDTEDINVSLDHKKTINLIRGNIIVGSSV